MSPLVAETLSRLPEDLRTRAKGLTEGALDLVGRVSATGLLRGDRGGNRYKALERRGFTDACAGALLTPEGWELARAVRAAKEQLNGGEL